MREQRRVLLQLVRDLINDETTAGRERVVRLLQELTFLVDLEYAERDPGENIVAVRETQALQLLRQTGCISVDHVDTRVIGELALQIARESGIELEQKQMRARIHSTRDLARVNAFARTIFGDYSRQPKIDLA